MKINNYMKKFLLNIFLPLILCVSYTWNIYGQVLCGSNKLIDYSNINAQPLNLGASCPLLGQTMQLKFNIPIIVHVLYDNPDYKTSYNQVQQMIDEANNFLPLQNIDGQEVDIDIQLAENGTCTPGYECILTTNPNYVANDYSTAAAEDLRLKSSSVWDVNHYLNVWIANSINFEGLLAGFSWTQIDFDNSGVNLIDGIVMDYKYLSVFIHEFGHWADLYHLDETYWNLSLHNNSSPCLINSPTWPNGDNCHYDDLVNDTKPVQTSLPLSFEGKDENGNYIHTCNDWLNGIQVTVPQSWNISPNCDPYHIDETTELWFYPVDNIMTYCVRCWTHFTPGQWTRMIIDLNTRRTGFMEQVNDPRRIDLSVNTDHTINEMLSKMGYSNLNQLCQSNKKFNIVLGGKLILDSGVGNPVCFKNGTIFKMLESAKISIQDQTILNLENVHIFACDVFWDRIFVEARSKINISNNCIIENGYNAISAEKGAIVNVENSIFNNNHISIYLTNTGTGEKTDLNVKACVFKSDDSFYLMDGGSIFQRPLAAIKIVDQSMVNLRADQNNRNTFKRLRNGILAYHSNVFVYYSDFSDISRELSLSPQSELLLERDGYAVKVYNGNTVSVVRYNTMDEVVYPIGGYKGVIVARDNVITNSDHGIVGYKLSSTKILDNNITSNKKGIFINESNMVWGLNGIKSNYVTLEAGIGGGYENGIGIDFEFTPRADIYNNFITIGANKAGIQLGNADETKVEDTDVWVNYDNNNRETEGISVLNSEMVKLTNNNIENLFPTDYNNLGILAATAFRGTYECNYTTDFNYGMQYFTNCDESFLYGNHFVGNTKDLVVGIGSATNVSADYSVIGPQGYWINREGNGNKWIAGQGVAHHSGKKEIIDRSPFLVRDNSFNPQGYLPRTIEAASDWFYNHALSNLSPCSGEPGSDLPPPCNSLIQKIQSIDTIRSIDPCKKMMWQYKYFKELIRMKKKGLLPPDCLAYIISHQNNVVLKVAEAGFMVDSIAKLHNTTAYYLNQLFTTTMQLDSLYAAGQYGTPAWDRLWSDNQEKYTVYQTSYEYEITRDRQMADSTKTVLNRINVVDSCLMVLVRVFKIRLNLLLGDTLQIAEKDWLKPIALSCPDAIGEGVYMARSLLSMYETGHNYPEMSQCYDPGIRIRESENTKMSDDKMIVYPNPAYDEINIQIGKAENETGTIKISDINGKIVYNHDIEKYDTILKIKTVLWQNGLYLIQYSGTDGNKTLDKIFINK